MANGSYNNDRDYLTVATADLDAAAFRSKVYDAGREARVRNEFCLGPKPTNPWEIFPLELLVDSRLTALSAAMPLTRAPSVMDADLQMTEERRLNREQSRSSSSSSAEDRGDYSPPEQESTQLLLTQADNHINTSSRVSGEIAIEALVPLRRTERMPSLSATLSNMEVLLRRLIQEQQSARQDAVVAKYLHSIVTALLYDERIHQDNAAEAIAINVFASADNSSNHIIDNQKHAQLVKYAIMCESVLKMGCAAGYAIGYGIMARSKALEIPSLAPAGNIFLVASFLANFAQISDVVPVTRMYWRSTAQNTMNIHQQYVKPLFENLLPRSLHFWLVPFLSSCTTTFTILLAAYAAVNGASSVASGTQSAMGTSMATAGFANFMLAMRASLMFRSLTRILDLLIAKIIILAERLFREPLAQALYEDAAVIFAGYVAVRYTIAQLPRLPQYEAVIGDQSDLATDSGFIALLALNLAFTAPEAMLNLINGIFTRLREFIDHPQAPSFEGLKRFINDQYFLRFIIFLIAAPTGSPGMQLAAANSPLDAANSYAAATLANLISLENLISESLKPLDFNDRLLKTKASMEHLSDDSANGASARALEKVADSTITDDLRKFLTRRASDYERNRQLYRILLAGVHNLEEKVVKPRLAETNIYQKTGMLWVYNKAGSLLSTGASGCYTFFIGLCGSMRAKKSGYTNVDLADGTTPLSPRHE